MTAVLLAPMLPTALDLATIRELTHLLISLLSSPPLLVPACPRLLAHSHNMSALPNETVLGVITMARCAVR